LHTVHTLYF
jgi:hypothetical protein